MSSCKQTKLSDFNKGENRLDLRFYDKMIKEGLITEEEKNHWVRLPLIVIPDPRMLYPTLNDRVHPMWREFWIRESRWGNPPETADFLFTEAVVVIVNEHLQPEWMYRIAVWKKDIRFFTIYHPKFQTLICSKPVTTWKDPGWQYQNGPNAELPSENFVEQEILDSIAMLPLFFRYTHTRDIIALENGLDPENYPGTISRLTSSQKKEWGERRGYWRNSRYGFKDIFVKPIARSCRNDIYIGNVYSFRELN